MEKRVLGRTGLEVTAIAFGGLPMQRCTLAEAGPVLNAALDAGINFIDTARAYTDSEEKIGCHVSSRRKEYYLASKSMARDRAGMARDIDISLATMKTDYIDLYQVHNVKTRPDFEKVLSPGGALEALQEAQKAGKIGHIGITGHSMDLLVEGLKTGLFSTVQAPFNCIESQAEQELFPLARKENIGIIVMKPLGGGQIDNPDLALRYILEHDITTAIPGMDEVRHVEENLAALKNYRPLSAAEREELKRLAAEIGANFCRRCGYCLPCTAGIDIPTMFIFHLQYTRYNMKTAIPGRYATLPAKASDCTECGACESRCPYDIPIRERMKKVAADLG
ncbi:aldo/keto reductase [Anaeroselena agilis]|uniref:Aldo/keto reductase n=1 Tax=Anaeroselena agilis TaxID=3063788 RepID=A0ABU3P3D1_9FIRM|nr:aldo/keto reductase [Selenomonadales bacterium 4137-cl]